MVRIACRVTLACVLTVAAAGAAAAQAPQANGNAQAKTKKHPNQVPETGPDQAADQDSSRFDRVIESVPITFRADGTIVAKLDESFMEATTATVEPSGDLLFEHFTGVERASAAVLRLPATGSLVLPARALPLLYPILEDKE